MPPRLPATELFDLASFAHAGLFSASENCWEALGRPLAAYLTSRLAREIRGEVAQGAYLVGEDIEIGEGTVVEPGAYIQGPAIIGKHCEIRHGAYVRGHVLIGDGCVIGHATEIKSAIVLDGAKAGHFAYIGDSILGNNVNLGAGTKLANFKLSGDEVVLSIDGERVRTGMRKLGALLGDRVQTGCNSVTSPGTILGKETFVFPCVSVRAGLYPSGSRLRG
jgi:UDP-N-acetylglucosamine diphosphorylase / glucose-1-phosphate thymidylyltransferase / UDP-N-acetylgalactosamine diphosphorylase / glucosamine-1-phosphate N-acetyltransferase / galactosamine-1-phosphate N-acetyltransferase